MLLVSVCPTRLLDVSHLSKDSCQLPFRRIFSTLYDLVEGDRHMFEDNVERCLSSEGVKSFDNVGMLDASMHIKRLLGSCNGKCPHGYEPRERRLSLCHSDRTVEVEIQNFTVDFPW